jgi:serine/threonine protein phosphatase PrpC
MDGAPAQTATIPARDARLEIAIGLESTRGAASDNQDYPGVYVGDPASIARYGVVAALADGVGGARGGRIAAELAVSSFIDGYLAQSETIGIRKAAGRSLDSLNRWIHGQGRSDPRLAGMATTLSVLILRGREAHVIHVGDSRVYRWRDGRLTRMTVDHIDETVSTRNALLRAVGAEDSVRADYECWPLALNDRYLLCSDGVHGVLDDRQIGEILGNRGPPEGIAKQLVADSLASASQDNCSALVIDITQLPAADQVELDQIAAALPISEMPRIGDTVDGYKLGSIIAEGRNSCLFKAVDEADGGAVVLKFPTPELAEAATARAAFVRETWIGARVRSPWLASVIEPAPNRRTRLYTVMPYYAGQTLEARLKQRTPMPLREGIAIGTKLARAVTVLHRAGIIHRDIKPHNVILQDGGGLRLTDFGLARLREFDTRPSDQPIPGTPSYMAPEMFHGNPGDELTDQFALGVTLYRMFSGGVFPYGEVEAFARPRFGRPALLARRRSDLPGWLDEILARAVAVSPEDRYGDVLEFAFALEHRAEQKPVSAMPLPLYHRNPILFWQLLSLLLAALLVLSLLTRH